MTFLVSVSIIRLIKNLWVGRSKIWQTLAVCIRSSPCVARSKFTQKFYRSNYRSFYVHMQNMHAKYAKISTIRKFPTIRYITLGTGPLCTDSLCTLYMYMYVNRILLTADVQKLFCSLKISLYDLH